MLQNYTEFQSEPERLWMEQNWKWTYPISAVYLLLIVIGQKTMRTRSPFKLQSHLIAWNTGLATFSIIGSWYTVSGLASSVHDVGLVKALCVRTNFFEGNSGYWSWLFVLSKVVELGDTAFLVLRKRPIIFLHVYHHITVLIFSWWQYQYLGGTAKWGITTNFVVHSIMYTYYAVRAAGQKLPKSVSIFITTLQILQMVIMMCYGIYIEFQKVVFRVKCLSSEMLNPVQLLLYVSYFVLFAKFFADAYLVKSTKVTSGKTKAD